MDYNIKDCVDRIATYVERNKKAEPLTQQDKQMISGHILPLITNRPPTRVDRTEITDQDSGESEIKPEND